MGDGRSDKDASAWSKDKLKSLLSGLKVTGKEGKITFFSNHNLIILTCPCVCRQLPYCGGTQLQWGGHSQVSTH